MIFRADRHFSGVSLIRNTMIIGIESWLLIVLHAQILRQPCRGQRDTTLRRGGYITPLTALLVTILGLVPVQCLNARENTAGSENPTR